MKNLILLLFACVISFNAFSQTDFNIKPWESDKYPLIIDPYGKNDLEFNQLVTDKKLKGIIHKASQGLAADNKYVARNAVALSHNLLYGSYHLGTEADPIKQADFYLETIGENSKQLMALDIEGLGKGNISLANAEKFIARIHEKTGKYPLLYINNEVFNKINETYSKESMFAKCPLWYARFLKKLPVLSTKVWDKVTLWQFACELNCQKCLQKDKNGDCIKKSNEYTATCPYKMPGTKNDIDINIFNGTFDELTSFWIN